MEGAWPLEGSGGLNKHCKLGGDLSGNMFWLLLVNRQFSLQEAGEVMPRDSR